MSLTGNLSGILINPNLKEVSSINELYQILNNARRERTELPSTFKLKNNLYVYNESIGGYEKTTGKTVSIETTGDSFVSEIIFSTTPLTYTSITAGDSNLYINFSAPLTIPLNFQQIISLQINGVAYPVSNPQLINQIGGGGSIRFDLSPEVGNVLSQLYPEMNNLTPIIYIGILSEEFRIKHNLKTLKPSVTVWTGSKNTTSYNDYWVPKFRVIDENTIAVLADGLYTLERISSNNFQQKIIINK